MASKMGISRAAVWKQIRGLKERGFEIESSTKKGYRLVRKPDLLDPKLIRSSLKTGVLGREIYCYQEVNSTNEIAKSKSAASPEGTVVLAETQTAGRGRLARPWDSPQGGIWMSIILKPRIPMAQAYRINMAVSVALARAISGLYGLEAKIKWPNDLLIGERKLCGILMEISAEVDQLDYAVVGIGINTNLDVSVFPDKWRATSISDELGSDVSRTDLIQRILQELEETYIKMGSEEIYEEWCRRSATLGKYVRITSSLGDMEGEAVAMSRDGALCLKTEGGLKRVLAGDCIHLRALSRVD